MLLFIDVGENFTRTKQLKMRTHWCTSYRNWTYEFDNYDLGILTILPWIVRILNNQIPIEVKSFE